MPSSSLRLLTTSPICLYSLAGVDAGFLIFFTTKSVASWICFVGAMFAHLSPNNTLFTVPAVLSSSLPCWIAFCTAFFVSGSAIRSATPATFLAAAFFATFFAIPAAAAPTHATVSATLSPVSTHFATALFGSPPVALSCENSLNDLSFFTSSPVILDTPCTIASSGLSSSPLSAIAPGIHAAYLYMPSPMFCNVLAFDSGLGNSPVNNTLCN